MIIYIMGWSNHKPIEVSFRAREEVASFIRKHKMKLKISLYVTKTYKIYEPKQKEKIC